MTWKEIVSRLRRVRARTVQRTPPHLVEKTLARVAADLQHEASAQRGTRPHRLQRRHQRRGRAAAKHRTRRSRPRTRLTPS